jgi:hypothetical protein
VVQWPPMRARAVNGRFSEQADVTLFEGDRLELLL